MSALAATHVIDFGQYIAGPLLGMLLADQGADVIKVDPPRGPVWDVSANAVWNRGKRSICLNLKAEAEREIAVQLIRHADVVIENFRPGVMERLGLGADAMMTANSSLIYCSLPGFAADDPRAATPAWEGIVGAVTATYRISPATNQPVYTAIAIASCYAAFQAAVSIAMALYARERAGHGQHITIPLFDAMFAAIGYRGMSVNGQPAQLGSTRTQTWTRQFVCSDSRWIQFHAGNLNFVRFLDAVGASEWTDAPNAQARAEALFQTRSASEWEAFCEAIGTECAICRTSQEWMESEHARQSQIVIAMDDPQCGQMLQPGINVRLAATPGHVRAPAPIADAHNVEILNDLMRTALARSAATIASTMRAALAGVKVLDLCIILAGAHLRAHAGRVRCRRDQD